MAGEEYHSVGLSAFLDGDNSKELSKPGGPSVKQHLHQLPACLHCNLTLVQSQVQKWETSNGQEKKQ